MPAKYRYPGRADMESVAPAGRMSDVKAADLFRYSLESDIIGPISTDMSQSISVPTAKTPSIDPAMERMANDHSLYDTSGK